VYDLYILVITFLFKCLCRRHLRDILRMKYIFFFEWNIYLSNVRRINVKVKKIRTSPLKKNRMSKLHKRATRCTKAPAYAEFEKGPTIWCIVLSLTLFLHKRLFSGLEPVTFQSHDNNFTSCTKATFQSHVKIA